MTNLEQTIHDYIKTLYKAVFTGVLKVNKLEEGYSLELGIPSSHLPMYLSYGEDDEAGFLKYICKELATRNLIRRHFYKIEKINEGERNNTKNR